MDDEDSDNLKFIILGMILLVAIGAIAMSALMEIEAP